MPAEPAAMEGLGCGNPEAGPGPTPSSLHHLGQAGHPCCTLEQKLEVGTGSLGPPSETALESPVTVAWVIPDEGPLVPSKSDGGTRRHVGGEQT